jgi:signal transduction histidine kinase
VVVGDRGRLHQVVTNLLTNAVKFSPQGGTITVAAAAPDAATVAIAVTDQGIGISPEHHAHIFERFYQVHPDGHGTGMGLGLFISHEIAALHGGELQVESPPAGGARFVLTVPGRAAAGVAEEAPTP